MSSIRLYILSALAEEGEMHGHQLRQLAEIEHVDMWTDFSVGGLYGALKRLAADGLIESARTEREGSYPERQIWRITHDGRVALAVLRRDTLTEIVLRPDPFDLAMSRLDLDKVDQLPELITERIESLQTMLAREESHTERITQYLTKTELFVMKHRAERIRAELTWHQELRARLPELIADELGRKES